MNDYQILDLLRKGDSQGLEYLFRQYYEMLVKTAVYLVFDKEVAEDLSQEAFVKVWEKRQQLPDIVNFKAYLIRIVKNSAFDHLNKANIVASNLEQFLYFKEETSMPLTEKQDELKEQISQAISLLPPKCRLIFSMNRFEGLTNEEIADYLEISKRTVETQISKALKILRTELKTVWNKGLFLWFC